MRSMIIGIALVCGLGLSYVQAQGCSDGCYKNCGGTFSSTGTRCSYACFQEECIWTLCLGNCSEGKKGTFCTGYGGGNLNTITDSCSGAPCPCDV
jgi:hypothetical protein